MSLTEDAEDLMKLKDWPTLVDNAIKDMELEDLAAEDPQLRMRVVDVFEKNFNWKSPKVPSWKMVTKEDPPQAMTIVVPNPDKSGNGMTVPDTMGIALVDRILQLLAVLKKAEMENKYVAIDHGSPESAKGDGADDGLLKSLEMSCLRAAGNSQSMDMKAQIRQFSKRLVSDNGVSMT